MRACRTPSLLWSKLKAISEGSPRGTQLRGRLCHLWGSCKARGRTIAWFLLFFCEWSWGRQGSSRIFADIWGCFPVLDWPIFPKFSCKLGRKSLLHQNQNAPSIVWSSIHAPIAKPRQTRHLVHLQRSLPLAQQWQSQSPYLLLNCDRWCSQTRIVPSHHQLSLILNASRLSQWLDRSFHRICHGFWDQRTVGTCLDH